MAGFKIGNPGDNCGCDCVPPRTLTLRAKDCGGNPIPGATVSVTGPGGFSASGTLAGTFATYSVTVPSAGSYPWTITDVSGTCGGTAVFGSTTLTVSQYCCIGQDKGFVCGKIRNQCVPLSGVTVEVWHAGGAMIASTITDGSGNYCFCAPAVIGAFIQIKVPAFGRYGDTTTGAFQAFFCNTDMNVRPDIELVPASGYHYQFCCLGGDGGVPIPDTLSGTDSVYGALTFNYSGGTWVATKTVNYPGCPPGPYGFAGCPPVTGVEVSWLFGGCTVGVVANNSMGCPYGGAYDHTSGPVYASYSGTGSPLSVTSGTINHPVYCGGGSVVVTE